ncbi:Putative RxLR effector [Phytophthora palmivora]|uniref:RxLR effector protein n=1 Tax=Phytophthora palmivora TaxID=4796 RepID=A0A2P4Y385_9STRA|nr:Putative RxLR effector [Phytophthora palmivora]
MRLRCFVLVLVFTFAVSCYDVSDANENAVIKNPESDSSRVVASESNVKRYLKGNKMTAVADEERALTGFTSLKALFQRFPTLDKNLIMQNPAFSNAKVYVSKHPRLKAAVTIVKGQLKAVAIIAAIALTGGYIAYLIKR